MSFWPFGQNANNSNINLILEDYFRVLHSLEEESQVTSTSGSALFRGGEGSRNVSTHAKLQPAATLSPGPELHGTFGLTGAVASTVGASNNTHVNESRGHAQKMCGSSNTRAGDYNHDNDNDDDDDDDNDNEDDDYDGVSMRPRYRNLNNVEPTSLISATSLTSTTSSAVSISPAETSTHNEEPHPITKKSLSHAFIDNILKESELLNELTMQNNTLLDFVCFGFFYDVNDNKVENIEYLLDQLMFCIDRINEDIQQDEDIENQAQDENGHITVEYHEQSENNSRSEDGYFIKNAVFDSIPPENDDTIIPFMHDTNDSNQSSYLNRANTISEIFALDIWLISESLVKDFSHLTKIWSMLFHKNFKVEKSPLIPIFLKINQSLLLTRQDQFLNFIRIRKTLVDDLLLHVEVSVLMDFFLKIISTDKQEAPTGMIELVYDQCLIPKLLSFLDNEKFPADLQACAGDFLKALISISTNAPLDEMSIGPNALTRQLCSETCIDCFLDAIINKRGPALTTSVSVVIELIRKNNSDYDQVNLLNTSIKSHPPSMRDSIYLGVMLKKFALNLSNLKKVLLDVEENCKDKVMTNQLGVAFKPLGFERFKVIELIAELLHCSNMGLMNSKRAERVVKERDEVRQHLVNQLQDALADLNMIDAYDREKNDTDGREPGFATNTSSSTQTTAVNDNMDEDIDESFEIPYVNMNQNIKLRQNPTIGDLFKIQLYDTQILPKIIQLFVEHPWNNFWHNVIFDVIQQLFNGRMDFSYNSFLVYSLFNNKSAGQFQVDINYSKIKNSEQFVDFEIARDLILQGYKDSHDFYERYNTNLGFMGHLVLIAEEIVKFSKVYKVELISPDIYRVLQNPDWVFYSEEALNDTRMMYSKILGGGDYLDDGNTSMLPENGDMPKGNGEDYIGLHDKQSNSKFSTQADLHRKLKNKLIKKSQEEVAIKNKENGVIILGPPPEI